MLINIQYKPEFFEMVSLRYELHIFFYHGISFSLTEKEKQVN